MIWHWQVPDSKTNTKHTHTKNIPQGILKLFNILFPFFPNSQNRTQTRTQGGSVLKPEPFIFRFQIWPNIFFFLLHYYKVIPDTRFTDCGAVRAFWVIFFNPGVLQTLNRTSRCLTPSGKSGLLSHARLSNRTLIKQIRENVLMC